MNKVLIILSIIVFSISTIFLIQIENKKKEQLVDEFVHAPSAIGSKENPSKRYDYEQRLIVDPKTGRVPQFIHQKELEFSKSIPTREFINNSSKGKINSQIWSLAGPSNVGGRTRAVGLDILNENTILAGGVSGGMWKSTNSGNSWTRTSHPATLNSLTCLVQDKRNGKENIWYHGTGELNGNSARAPGAPFRGDGIFISKDNGDSWDIIPSTSNNQLAIFESPFNYVWNIVINKNRTDIDEIFAAVYGGIVRSQDGGNTWTTVLGDDLLNLPAGSDLNSSKAPFYTNIIQTPTGTFYASLSVFTSEGSIIVGKGIFKSVDGENWSKISANLLAADHRRTVMAYSPSNEGIVYFFVDATSPQLLKYDDNSSFDPWVNLSQNIPLAEDEEKFDGMNTQESFNMIVKVHPDNSDVVFLGGTNLYKSADGFKTKDNIQWIGGYDTENDGGQYAGHHPDQHDLIFYPSNSKKSISAHVGGLSITSDNLSDEVNWVSLNNGYITSQFYTVSVGHDEGSDVIIGGMQDNGSYAKTSFVQNAPWNRILGGDGSFCATTPGNLFWYFSFQESQIYRLTLNSNSQLTSFARVDPTGGKDYLFVNPFVLDPNNYNRMYMAGGEVVWRNDNLSQISNGSQKTTITNWTKLLDTRKGNSQITAIEISTNPANILYYGLSNGDICKVINANEPIINSESIISNLEAIPVCISVDPNNADNIAVVYSNYNIPSIFFSDNGGNTFTDVGGNLEENSDGTGNGPSIRWAEIIPMNDGSYMYFIGTSVGLYSTNILNGASTVWIKEGNETIGNAVIRMIDYRSSDGKLVIATHGNGVFESHITNTLSIIKTSTQFPDLVVKTPFPNPFNAISPIKFNFDIPELGPVRIDILNSTGQHVRTLLHAVQFPGNNSATWNGVDDRGTAMRSGMYHYRIGYGDQVVTGKIILVR
ncbi:MAG: hypothetical protein ACI9P5_004657 [Saprospiraceae bacterium]